MKKVTDKKTVKEIKKIKKINENLKKDVEENNNMIKIIIMI